MHTVFMCKLFKIYQLYAQSRYIELVYLYDYDARYIPFENAFCVFIQYFTLNVTDVGRNMWLK